MHRARGVTLIELMVVVVVLAIIATIAVPSYRGYLRRAQRVDATAALLTARTAQERFFLQNNRYMNAAEFAAVGLNVSERTYYDIAVGAGAGPAPGFILTATPMAGGPQADDAPCATFTINEVGLRNSGPSPITTCWK